MRVLTAQHVVATVDPTSRLWAAAADIEAEVFELAGYAPAEQIRAEYRPYDDASTFIVAIEDGRVLGAVRLIRWSEHGFKTLVDIETHRLRLFADHDPSDLADPRFVEVGTMALARHHTADLATQARVAMTLYGGIVGYARMIGADTILASWDESFWTRFLSTFGSAAGVAVGPPTEFLGSPTLVAIVHVDTCLESARRTRAAFFHALERNAGRLQIVLAGDASLLSEAPDRAQPALVDLASRPDAAPSPR